MSLTLGLIGGAIGGLNAIGQNRALADAQREQLGWQRLGAYYKYKATEDSVNIMKGLNREATQNAITEVMRAESENLRQTDTAIDKAVGAMSAKNEGLTAGQSKGRELADMYMKGNKALEGVKDQSAMSVSALIEQQDKTSNQLNNTLLKQYQNLTYTLMYPGKELTGSANRIFSGIASGAMSGLSLSGLNSGTKTILPKGSKGRLPSSAIGSNVGGNYNEYYSGIRLPSLI